jgi:hypothetical protein
VAYQETLPRIRVSRKSMMKRVARFNRLKGFDGGLPDSQMPGCERILCTTTTPTRPLSR